MLDGNDLHDCASDIYDIIYELEAIKGNISEASERAKYSCDVESLENIKNNVTQTIDNLYMSMDLLDELGDEVEDYTRDCMKDNSNGEDEWTNI